jgi:CheY-like chemotaxis protein
LAHDFNNLLTSIHGSTTLLSLDFPANTSGEEHLRRIEQATTQAAKLVRQMMAFGRRTPTVFVKLHLPVVVRDALHLLRSSVPKGIEFRFVNEAVNDMVHADASQLQQVLVNLATNASHAMACGAGELTVKISEVQLPDATRPETASVAGGEYLRLTVSDSGCGIAPDVLPRIFEPFFTTKPMGSGTGLGLAVVHGIISQHHGTIGVQSGIDQGTTVIIHLPKIANIKLPSGDNVSQPNGATSPLTEAGNILLVDDDELVRETLEAGLRHRKYRVTCAAGGAQALKLVREQSGSFDAVITDQMMPGMTGIELGEILARESPTLSLILVTGFASALSETKVKAMGFAAMLMKPVTIDDLDKAVQRARQRDQSKRRRAGE